MMMEVVMSFRRFCLIGALSLWFVSPAAAEPGDWPMFKSGPDRTSFNPDETKLDAGNVGSLTEKWTITPNGVLYQSPVVVGDVVYVVTDNEVAAHQTRKGRRIWRRKLNPPGAASAAVNNGVVYVSLEGATVMAIDATNGQIKWKVKTSNRRSFESRSSPLVSKGLVYVGGGDGKLYALRAKTGEVEFAARTGGSQIISSPALADGVAYVTSEDRSIYAFNARNGRKLWSFEARGPLEETPAVADGKVFLSDGVGGRLYALDAMTGEEQWSRPVDGLRISAPAVAEGKVVVTNNNVFAFNANTGRPLWEGFTAESGVGPAIANGVVYTLNRFGRMAAFDLRSGNPLAALITSAPTNSTPVVANGVLYLTSDSVQAFSVR